MSGCVRVDECERGAAFAAAHGELWRYTAASSQEVV